MKKALILLALLTVVVVASVAIAQTADDAKNAKIDDAIALLEEAKAIPADTVTVTETVTATITETVTTTPPPTTPPPTTSSPPPAPTIPPPAPGFPSRAEALARANVVVVSGPKTTQVRFGSPPPDTTYDLRGMTSTAYPSSAFPTSFGRDVAGARTVIVGGSVTGTQPRDWSWDQVHAVGGAGMTMLGSDFQVSYDFYAENQHDGLQMLPPAGGGSKYLIDGLTCVWVRDDCIEADTEFSGTIQNVVGDGVNTAISLGQSTKNPNAVTEISNAIFIHEPMVNARAADGIGHQTLFKQAPGGTVNLTNVTDCLYENPITPSRIQIRPAGTWTNVVFVLGPGWAGPDPAVPAGATVSRDWTGLCT